MNPSRCHLWPRQSGRPSTADCFAATVCREGKQADRGRRISHLDTHGLKRLRETRIGGDNVVAVIDRGGVHEFVYAGDRWTTADLGASPLVLLPLTLSGTTVALGWQSSWSLDVTTGTWTGASSPSAGAHRLTGVHSGMLLDVSGASTADGAKVVQWSATGGTNQQWTIGQVSAGVYTLVGVASGKCLEVPGSSTTQGTQLDIWTCNGGANQRWAPLWTGTTYVFVNLNSGWVVDVSGSSTAAGATVDQWAANGGANQSWGV